MDLSDRILALQDHLWFKKNLTETMHVMVAEIHGKSLCLALGFVANLKLL